MISRSPPYNPRLGLALVLVGAFIGLLAGEAFFRKIAEPRPPLVEAEDGIEWFRENDPTTVVLGSSHARAFLPLAQMLTSPVSGDPAAHRERVAVISLEYGTLTSYRWLVEHRLLPIMDRDLGGGRERPGALARAILVTDWWDACGRAQGPAATNLPARVWTLGDFVEDAAGQGLTAYNANYLQGRLDRWFRDSVLVRSRGHEHLVNALRQLVRKKTDAERRVDLQGAIEAWRDMVEAGAGCEDPVQRQALDDLVTVFQSRGVEVAIVLYPRMPATISERARDTTLAEFSAWARAWSDRRGLRFLDLSLGSPLVDEDWESDLDHVTAAGARRFSEWALRGPLGFLREPPTRPADARFAISPGGAP